MTDRFSLAGRRALVCGASQGIGRATALALAEQGAEVSVLARDAAALDAVVDTITGKGGAARKVVADHDDRASLQARVAALIAEVGPHHILVHNTGGPAGGPLLDATDEAFLQAFGRNVLAGQLLVRLLLPGMVAAGYGRIVAVLSTSAREPIANLGVGNTVRAAMAGWSKTLAQELPASVTINNLLPGYTATARLDELKHAGARRQNKSPEDIERAWLEQIPMHRLASPDEIAGVIAFLASPAGSYVRGQSLAVDGGRMRSL